MKLLILEGQGLMTDMMCIMMGEKDQCMAGERVLWLFQSFEGFCLFYVGFVFILPLEQCK